MAALQRVAVDVVGGRIGRRRSAFAIWIRLLFCRTGNHALLCEEVRAENVGERDFDGSL